MRRTAPRTWPETPPQGNGARYEEARPEGRGSKGNVIQITGGRCSAGCMPAHWSLRRGWVKEAYVGAVAPLMVVLAVTFTSGHWTG